MMGRFRILRTDVSVVNGDRINAIFRRFRLGSPGGDSKLENIAPFCSQKKSHTFRSAGKGEVEGLLLTGGPFLRLQDESWGRFWFRANSAKILGSELRHPA